MKRDCGGAAGILGAFYAAVKLVCTCDFSKLGCYIYMYTLLPYFGYKPFIQSINIR